MKFNKTALVASAAALSLGLAACDSPAENEMEDDIEAMEDNRDETVDMMEDTGQITDDQADAMDDQTDAMEESMEEQVDEGEAM
jgi:Spy/CpxP family protein refolding chaperone